jgi:hypothetical protein
MSNTRLTAITIVVLAAHIVTLAIVALRTRNIAPMLLLNGAVALAVLGYLAMHPRWLRQPIDWQLALLALFEALVLTMAVLAARQVSVARICSWLMFGGHFAVSGLAVAFALMFRISRLI